MRNTKLNVGFGRLMSPNEVVAATSHRIDVPDGVKLNWFLCGDIPEPLFTALKWDAANLTFRVRAFSSPTAAFVMFTLQRNDVQVRFVMGLGDERVEACLSDVCKDGLMLSLSTAYGGQAILCRFEIEPEKLLPVLTISKACPAPSDEKMAAELGFVLIEALKPETVPSAIGGITVRQVYPVVILPEHLPASVPAQKEVGRS